MKKILTNIKYLTLAIVLITGVFANIKQASAFVGGGVVTYSNNLDISYVVSNGNLPPTANAGADTNITLPTDYLTLPAGWAQAHDPNGDNTISQTTWVLINGAAITMDNGGTLTPTFHFPLSGAYTIQLTVVDDQGESATDDLIITVNPVGGSNLPTANAGPDKTITMPASDVSVTGTCTDLGGTSCSYAWTQISRPAAATDDASIVSPTSATTNITKLLTEGVYVFRLTVTDNDGNTDDDDMQVTVNPVGGPGGGGPSAPPSLGAVAGACTTGKITITWSRSTTPTPPSITYDVLRKTPSTGYSTIAGGIASPDANISYVDTNGLVPSTTYFYVVRAVSSDGTSGNSPEASAVAPAATCPPITGACSTPRTHYDCAVGTSPVGTQHASTGPSDPWTWYCVADTSSPMCSEPAGGSTRQCNDGLDNDKDGFIDFIGGTLSGNPVAKDPQCTSATDNSERNLTEVEL